MVPLSLAGVTACTFLGNVLIVFYVPGIVPYTRENNKQDGSREKVPDSKIVTIIICLPLNSFTHVYQAASL